MTIDRTPIRAQLLTTLRVGTADDDAGQYEWGDNDVPPSAKTTNPTLPYGILYDLPSTFTIEAADGVQADAQFVQQVTVVGGTPLDTGTLADRARKALCALTGAVGDVTIVRVDSDGPPPLSRVGSLFQSAESFTVYLSGRTLDSGG